MANPELTDQEIDILLERFDQTEPRLQRRIVVQLLADREHLLAAAKALWADRDAEQTDQAACRRLHDAWRDLGATIALVERKDGA